MASSPVLVLQFVLFLIYFSSTQAQVCPTVTEDSQRCRKLSLRCEKLCSNENPSSDQACSSIIKNIEKLCETCSLPNLGDDNVIAETFGPNQVAAYCEEVGSAFLANIFFLFDPANLEEVRVCVEESLQCSRCVAGTAISSLPEADEFDAAVKPLLSACCELGGGVVDLAFGFGVRCASP